MANASMEFTGTSILGATKITQSVSFDRVLVIRSTDGGDTCEFDYNAESDIKATYQCSDEYADLKTQFENFGKIFETTPTYLNDNPVNASGEPWAFNIQYLLSGFIDNGDGTTSFSVSRNGASPDYYIVDTSYDDILAELDIVLTVDVAAVANGTVSLPSIAFASDPDTGFYRVGANHLGVAANGVKVAGFGVVGLEPSATTSITAHSGGGQGSAVALTTTYNEITVCAANGDSVKLAAGILGSWQVVTNSGATPAAVFTQTGGTINGGSANASVNVLPGCTIVFYGTGTNTFITSGKSVGTSSVTVVGSSGGYTIKKVESASTTLSGATTNIAQQVPSGAKILGTQLRVDTLITSGAGTTWSGAYNTGATQTLGSGKAFTKNTKVDVMFNVNAATDIASAATDITITCTGGTFTAGAITAVTYYAQFETMISV